MKPVIGVLGGMGPRATVQFEQMLLDRLPGGDQAIPTIISLNDGSVPDRSQYIMGSSDNPGPRLQRNLRILERAGATLICIPCNTACVPQIFGQLQPESSRLIAIPNEVIRLINQSGYGSVYLLATPGTVRAGIYQSLCRENNVQCIEPPAAVQCVVTDVIHAVKRGDMRTARRMSRHLRALIARNKCDAVILGCTELPLVKEDIVPSNVAMIDTLAVLADSCVSYTNNQKKGENRGVRPIYA